MHIEAATDKDIPQLQTFMHISYRGELARTGWTCDSDILDGNRTSEKLIKEAMTTPGGSYLKLTDEQGQIIGCVYIKVIPQQKKAYVGSFCVHPSLQSKGLGSKLLAASEDVAKKAGCLALVIDVITCRKELITWYENRGFKFVGKVFPLLIEYNLGTPKVPLELGTWEKVLE